jgi:zinc D-Ala-D-Ala dipeptidase
MHALAEGRVPDSAQRLALKAGYRNAVPIDLAGVLNAEPCVDVRSLGLTGRNFYNAQPNPPYGMPIPGSIPDLLVRRGVGERLVMVDLRLRDRGLGLYVLDAWRPQAVQRYFHDVWFPAWLTARRPTLSGDELRREVEQYWSAPTIDEHSPSPHSTGGAVDLTIVELATGHPLFMGGIFDDVTELSWTDWFERREARSMSDEVARANRRILYWAMAEAGFANNPTEWWHFSWGDQMWARLTQAPAAHYGPCQPLGPEAP